MTTAFYVIGGDGYVSFPQNENGNMSRPEDFYSEEGAVNRACELALEEPGTLITVCKAIKIVRREVSPPTITEVK